MRRGTFLVVAGLMVAVAAAVRIHNGLVYPPLRAYDGFGHFTYIWYMSETGRVPLATAGWSFFHPPLYYFAMAALWDLLDGVDALQRLHIGSVIMGVLGLAHALVSYLIVRRYFPGQRLIHLLAPGLMLFLPVHIYSAPFLGNESLNGVLCSLALLALLGTLARPTLLRHVGLGLLLGLAMLTKFSALAVVAGALGTIGLKALRTGALRTGAGRVVVVTGVLLLVCGWFYARNVTLYGTPFKLSRDEFMVQHVESLQPRAASPLRYLLFDPVIFYRPAWPRGFSMTEDLYPGGGWRPLRESVWTGMYANTWFDAFGGWIVPPVTKSELARRAGQLLLTLGLVPTLVMALGFASALQQLWNKGWDDTVVAMLLTFAAMLAIFILGTLAVPIPAAVKATYFVPIGVVLSFWFALGLSRVRCHGLVIGTCGVLAVVSTATFAYGLMFDPADVGHDIPFAEAATENLSGVVYFAAGERTQARRHFTAAAARGWHLGYENLALLAYERGALEESRHLLKRAIRLQPSQAFGTPAHKTRSLRTARAEHLNLLAAIEQAGGRPGRARRGLLQARTLDGTIPDTYYNLGMLTLHDSQAAAAVDAARAAQLFEQALRLDPRFVGARAMIGFTRALQGDCKTGRALLSDLDTDRLATRTFPHETGTGAPQHASIARGRVLLVPPPELRQRCRRGP